MDDPRIVHVKNLGEAAALIAEEYRGRLLLPLRGIIVSVGGLVDLSWKHPDFKELITFHVKPLEKLLEEGTELDRDEEYGWTRVDYSERGAWAFTCASTRRRIEHCSKRAGIPDEVKALLKPALIVYDDSLLKKSNDPLSYNVLLPEDKEELKRIILKVYVNHTEETS
jgi:hypothetical protein